MAKAPTARELAAELCRKFPGTTSKALARKLYDEHKERFTTFDAAILVIRRARGNQGKKNRVYADAPRPNGDPAVDWINRCPASAAEPWTPVQIDGPCKVLILSDIHVPYHSREAVEAAVKYGRKLNPDVLLLNGDAMDFHRISRWQQDPKKRSFKQEIDDGKQLLGWLRGQFPKARFIFKCGNHEQRLDAYVWAKCVEFFELENLQLQNVLGFEDYGIERVDDNPILAGKLAVLHGHEIGKGIFSPVNPARGAFLRTNHTVLIGHLHRPSSHAESNMWHEETMTWSTGCLCGLQPEYARINRWSHGFCHVDVAADNQFNVHNYRLSQDFIVRTA